jgi:histidinol-phosphate aminotransferase
MDSLQERITACVRPEIRALNAYHVPAAGDYVKLDAMENPYRWPPEVVERWLAALREVELNRYPDPQATALKARLRETMDVPDGMDVLLGNGSDELIQVIATALGNPGSAVLAPEPSFVMYRMIATYAGMEYVGVPLADDFGLDMAAMTEAIETHRPAVIFLAYPNNPTGNLFDTADIEAVLRMAPGLVVVDEAYHAFAGASFMARLAEFDNLVVMRTVSKIGLAGLRLGFLAGRPEWLGEFDKVRLPYNINVLTQVSACFALDNAAVLDEQTALIRRDRDDLAARLASLPGVEVFPSAANFLLFRVAPGRATPIFEGLREGGVLIKNLAAAGGALDDCLRVTVGTPEENARFLDTLERVLAAVD